MQFELADRLGISASMLSLLEAGKREPTIPFLRQVARELEIPSSVLFVVALTDDDVVASPAASQMRYLTGALFEAARHSLAAKNEREQRKLET